MVIQVLVVIAIMVLAAVGGFLGSYLGEWVEGKIKGAGRNRPRPVGISDVHSVLVNILDRQREFYAAVASGYSELTDRIEEIRPALVGIQSILERSLNQNERVHSDLMGLARSASTEPIHTLLDHIVNAVVDIPGAILDINGMRADVVGRLDHQSELRNIQVREASEMIGNFQKAALDSSERAAEAAHLMLGSLSDKISPWGDSLDQIVKELKSNGEALRKLGSMPRVDPRPSRREDNGISTEEMHSMIRREMAEQGYDYETAAAMVAERIMP